MEAGALKLLESATQRTLHAHAFSRSSSQASAVMTDLLSRYLTLLTSTCAKYAQHAGRTHLSVYDAIGALDELGVNLEELSDYCSTEGKELNRYALVSARRMEDLNELRSQLSEGLRLDRDDAIPLVYEPTPQWLEELENEDEDEEDEDEDDEMVGVEFTSSSKRPASPIRHSTPPLPLSPVSNPASPRKQARISGWEPPEHIPEFLPPFPVTSEEPSESPTTLESGPKPSQQPPTSHSSMLPPSIPSPVPGLKVEKPTPSMTLLQQPVTTTTASDIFVQVPYSQSSLSSLPEWHLPSAAPPSQSSNQLANNRQIVKLATPQPEHALLSAYHHILTNRPASNPPPLNPARHKVAMALMHDAQTNPKWTPADSLFGTVSPCPPRVAPIGPSYPIAIGEAPGEDSTGGGKGKDAKDKGKDKDKEAKLPPMPPRPVVDGSTRMAPFVSQQNSRIPDLARLVLPSGILARTSRLSHPPALFRGSQPVVKLSSAVPAPWNANPLPEGPGAGGAQGSSAGPGGKGKDKDKEGAAGGSQQTNGKDAPKPVLPDAKLYATWDYETKDFTRPLTTLVRGRPRMASVQGGAGGGPSGLVVNTRAKGVK